MRRYWQGSDGLRKRGMFNAFLPRALLWLHSTSPSPRGIYICFPRSGTPGRPCWQTLDVWAEVDGFSSQGPRVMSSGPHSQVEGMGESWHRKKRVSLPLLVFLPTFFSGRLSYDKRLYPEPSLSPSPQTSRQCDMSCLLYPGRATSLGS